MGESWSIDPAAPSTVLDPQILWARHFRYDSGRARYLNQPLDPDALEDAFTPSVTPLAGERYVQTIYDGDEAYADVQPHPFGAYWTLFAPGLGRVSTYDPFNDPPPTASMASYVHADHLGTLRGMSDALGNPIDYNGPLTSGVDAVYTAFGEPIVNTFADGGSNRYGYVGAHGYQAHDEMPFLHVGHRYYDPGSGRFLQRDPLGTMAHRNVYSYVRNNPLIAIDPSGLYPWGPKWDKNKCSAYCGDRLKKSKKRKKVSAITCAAKAEQCVWNCEAAQNDHESNPSFVPYPPDWDPWEGPSTQVGPPVQTPPNAKPNPNPSPDGDGSCGCTGIEVFVLLFPIWMWRKMIRLYRFRLFM